MRSKTPRLPHIVFETTSQCNLNCLYCYNIWKRPRAEGTGDADYRHSVKTLKRFFRMADVSHVSLSGGEPFLSPRFPELVLSLRLSGKSVSIVSNGNGASLEDYKYMKELGVGLIELPILSPEAEIHDSITGVKGSWNKSLQSLETVLSLGIPAASVIIMTGLNYQGITDTMEFLKNKGVRRIMINRFNLGGAGIENRMALSLSISEIREIYPTIDQWAGENDIPVSSNVCIPHCVIDPKNFVHIKMTSCSKDPQRLPVTLDFEGNVRLCNHSPVVLGNIWKETVSSILSSSYISEFASTVPHHCTGCDLFDSCLGGCRSAGEQFWGTLEKGDPLMEAWEA